MPVSMVEPVGFNNDTLTARISSLKLEDVISMLRLEGRVCYTRGMKVTTASRPIQQRLIAWLTVFFMLAWSLPLNQGFNMTCNGAGPQRVMGTVSPLKSHETQAMPICPIPTPMHCAGLSCCVVSCLGSVAVASDSLRILVFTKTHGFVTLDPTLRSQNTNVFDPPPKA